MEEKIEYKTIGYISKLTGEVHESKLEAVFSNNVWWVKKFWRDSKPIGAIAFLETPIAIVIEYFTEPGNDLYPCREMIEQKF